MGKGREEKHVECAYMYMCMHTCISQYNSTRLLEHHTISPCVGLPQLNESNILDELYYAGFAAAHWRGLGLKLGIESHVLETIR